MVEAVPDVFGTSERAWDVEETDGPPAAISKKHALEICVIELKLSVKVLPLEMG
jgi:hypothetical protein